MGSPSAAPGPALQRIIDQRHGAFTRGEVHRSGHTEAELATWLRNGTVVSATRGGFHTAPQSWPGWATMGAERQEALRECLRMRAILAVLPATLLGSHATALLLHGLPRSEPASRHAVCQVMATDRSTRTRRHGVRQHRLVPGTQPYAGPMQVVSVADAVAQYALVSGLAAGRLAGAAALRDELLLPASLAAACRRLAPPGDALRRLPEQVVALAAEDQS